MTEPTDTDGGDPAPTLQRARRRIASLSDSDGAFVVACKDSGARPEPVSDATFSSYDDAESARDAARTYRAALRDLDPSLPAYDLVPVEQPGGAIECSTVRESTAERRPNGLPRSRQTVTLAGARSDEWLRIENGPVVHLTGPDSRLDDEVVERQLDSKL